MTLKDLLKTPKGTRDYGPSEIVIREKVFALITSVFKKYGASAIDTPVMELKEVLTGKYGEDSKLIYDLKDQGGELLALRYDLTVPFARYLATNKSIKQMKRYQIGKVYRRDQPVMTKGRCREFYQCDIDFAGIYESMVPEAVLLKIIVEVLSQLDIGTFTIKINHRKLLDGIFEACGVPKDKLRAISSSIDKLDKMAWPEVRKEMVDSKGLSGDVADKIWTYVQHAGGPELLPMLAEDVELASQPAAQEALLDLRRLYEYLKVFQLLPFVSFNLSLARGLDYYTGMIIEAILDTADGVGSIAGGGRYDNLVANFSGGGHSIPCVGFSFGIERLFSVIEGRMAATGFKVCPTQVLVGSVGDQLLCQRMAVCNELWDAGIQADFLFKRKSKLLDQYEHCEKHSIPLLVFFGEEELNAGEVKIKEISNRDDKGIAVPRVALVARVKELLAAHQASLQRDVGKLGLEPSVSKLSL